MFPGDAPTAEALIKNADAAMHHGKKAEHGRLEFFRSRSARARQAPVHGGGPAQGIGSRRVHPELSAAIGVEGMRVEAVEALLRWWHRSAFVSPDEFIPLAEQSGLIVQIGDWVLHEACAQARRCAMRAATAGKLP